MHPTHPPRRRWPTMVLLVVTALLLALAAAVLIAPPVGAHPLGGVEPSNYRTRVLAVRPAVPGLSVTAVDAGTRLRLVNTGRQDVVVLGYQSEPWLRVGPGGVFENSRSPTLGLAADWRRVGSSPSVTWHDHRAHWEAEEPPVQVRRAPGSAQVVVPEWTVKLRTGGRLVDVVGEVRWVPGPSPLPWLVGAALLAMAVVAVGRTRRWTGALVAVNNRAHPTRRSAVDNHAHPTRRSARLPLRGPQQPEAGYLGAQRWARGQRSAEEGQRWAEGWVDDPDGADLMDPDLMDPERPEPGRVPELHVVGRTRRVARERAAVTSTSATVLPWPGPRRPSSHDPDLPGGA